MGERPAHGKTLRYGLIPAILAMAILGAYLIHAPVLSSGSTGVVVALAAVLAGLAIVGAVRSHREAEARRAEDARKRTHAALVDLLRKIAVEANEAVSGFGAIRQCLDAVCEYAGWPVGHAYVARAGSGGALAPSDLWRAAGDGDFEAFRIATLETPLEEGRDLPGRVLASGRPEWIADVSLWDGSPRADAARRAGLGAGFALPVLVGREVAAILEFFSAEPAEPDPELIEALSHIGIQLGHVVERKRAEEETRRSLVDQEIIAGIMRLSLSALSIDEIMDRALELVLSSHGLGLESKGGVFFMERDENDAPLLVLKAQRNLAPSVLERCSRLGIGTCLCGKAAESGDIIHAAHMDERHELTFEGMADHGHYCAPIKADDEVLGVLNLYVPAGHKRSDAEDRFIAAVADTLAAIVRQRRVEQGRNELSQVVEQNTASVVITDTRGRIEYVNPKFVSVTGHAAEDVIGEQFELLQPGRGILDVLSIGGAWQGEVRSRRKDGSAFWEFASLSPVRGEDGAILRYLAVMEDITLRKDYEDRLLRQANFDDLTGMPNRLLAADRLQQAMTRAQRESRQVALMFIDLDNFKKINDTLGHGVGDGLIRQAAERIRSCLRDSDTVARLGGDEFAVVLPDLEDSVHAEVVAEKILDICALPYAIDGHELFVTASIGITVYPNDAAEARLLMRNADAAMYRAKEEGRSTVRFFTSEMNERAQNFMRLEMGLRHALENGELVLFFQPLVDNASGGLVGAEALARWRSPTLGLVPPGEFIPLAEDTGLVVPIGEWVIRAACEEAARWRTELQTPLYVSVNVSSRQFQKADLTGVVTRALADTGLPPESLELEITENVLMEESDDVNQVIHELYARGVGFAIDDFGTGYSSLGYLRRFPFDTLKIDRSFVRDVTSDAGAADLVKSIVAMANSLHLRVVAEGVETAEQREFVKNAGADISQGWYFSKAVPSEEFILRAKDWNRGEDMAV